MAGVRRAENCKVAPRSREPVVGVKSIPVGVGVAEVPTGLLPPQPFRAAKPTNMKKTAKIRETDRRMYPPRRGKMQPSGESMYLLENVQCRGEPVFEQGLPGCPRACIQMRAIVLTMFAGTCYI